MIIKFDTNHNRRGKGYWKLNNLLLNDKAYCENIISIFQNTVDEYNDKIDLHSLWELCKIRFKEYSIKYSIIRKRNNNVTKLEHEITSLDNYLQDNKNDKYISEKWIQLKAKYDKLLIEKSDGAKIRARVKWWEEGERSTSYFLNLE